MSTPSGILKAVVQPLETQALDALTKAGSVENRAVRRILLNRNGLRCRLVNESVSSGQDWRTLGRTPETQMRKANPGPAGQYGGTGLWRDWSIPR